MSSTPTRKPFNQTLHTENDDLGRAAGIAYLKNKGIASAIATNPDTFGVDLLFVSDGYEQSLEVEIKRVWNGNVFPYSTIQIPQRKSKYFKDRSDYLLLNADATACLLLDPVSILKSPLKEVPNKYMGKGEMFYQVSLSDARLFTFPKPVTTTEHICCSEMNLTRNNNAWACSSCSK